MFKINKTNKVHLKRVQIPLRPVQVCVKLDSNLVQTFVSRAPSDVEAVVGAVSLRMTPAVTLICESL